MISNLLLQGWSKPDFVIRYFVLAQVRKIKTIQFVMLIVDCIFSVKVLLLPLINHTKISVMIGIET